MDDLFSDNRDSGLKSPDMLLSNNKPSNMYEGYRYRVERFALGSSDTDDDQTALETLLTRSIQPNKDILILDRKDSISATTGVYTCVLIYLEKTPVSTAVIPGENNA